MSARKLLLADDSITVQKVVNLTFAEEGIDVVSVSNGDAALERIAAEAPDIALLDVNMPGANGYQVCEAIRTNDETKHIPVILLVGSFEPFDESEASRVGANAYLTKPFHSIRQLVEQVDELLKQAKPREESVPEPVQTYGIAETSQELPQEHSETFAAPAGRNSHDIEDLYTQSIEREETTSAYAPPAAEEVEFVDQGLDDEMIETNVVDLPQTAGDDYSFEPTQAGETVLETAETYQAEQSFGAEESSQPTPTFEVVRPQVEPDQVWASEPAYQSNEADSSAETVERAEDSVTEFEPWKRDEAYEQQRSDVSFADSADSGQASGEAFADETEPRYGDDVRTEEFSTSSAGLSSPFDTPADSISENTVRFENYTPPEVPGDRKFEEIELLELPPVGERTIELTTAERAELMSSNKEVVSLSPELMDMIVERVVARLSEKY